MDAHFHEYLAAVAGLQELYGCCSAETTEFHEAACDASLAEADPAPIAA